MTCHGSCHHPPLSATRSHLAAHADKTADARIIVKCRNDQPPKDSPLILHYTLPPSIPPDIIPLFKNISFEQQNDPKLCKIISLLKSNLLSI